jgi:hypothetical protein
LGDVDLIGKQSVVLAGRHAAGKPHVIGHLFGVARMRMEKTKVIMQRLGEVGLVIVERAVGPDMVHEEIVGVAAATLALKLEGPRGDRSRHLAGLPRRE